jgi:hypothetical protein
LFIVAPEIVDLFGGEGATETALAEQFTTYDCMVCDRQLQVDTSHPATVVVVIYDAGTGPLGLQLAHPTCSPSQVMIVLGGPTGTGRMILPAMAWRCDAGDPGSVVVIAPRTIAHTIDRRSGAGGDLLDLLVAALLACGFQVLTAPDMPLPVVTGRLFVQFPPGQRIRVTDAAGNTFYDGPLPVPEAFAELAQVTGLIGLVVVAGINLDHTRDHVADLHTAIRNGNAVGAAVEIDAGQPPQPADPALPAGATALQPRSLPGGDRRAA